MPNTTKYTSILFVTFITALLSSNVNAAASSGVTSTDIVNATVGNEVDVSFDHPQTISIGDPVSITGQATDTGVSATTWTITSNNAVRVNFTGTSFEDNGTIFSYPRFHKQDVDANGVAIENNYDHLLTRFGVIVSGMQTISGTQSVWKGGDTPDGTPEQFTLALNGIGSPDNLIGRIMPSDAGLFDLSVHATGRGDTSTTQSGIYTATLTAVITAEEQL